MSALKRYFAVTPLYFFLSVGWCSAPVPMPEKREIVPSMHGSAPLPIPGKREIVPSTSAVGSVENTDLRKPSQDQRLKYHMDLWFRQYLLAKDHTPARIDTDVIKAKNFFSGRPKGRKHASRRNVRFSRQSCLSRCAEKSRVRAFNAPMRQSTALRLPGLGRCPNCEWYSKSNLKANRCRYRCIEAWPF